MGSPEAAVGSRRGRGDATTRGREALARNACGWRCRPRRFVRRRAFLAGCDADVLLLMPSAPSHPTVASTAGADSEVGWNAAPSSGGRRTQGGLKETMSMTE